MRPIRPYPPSIAAALAVLCLVALLSACAAPPAEEAVAVKISVEEDGVYQVTAAELHRVGFDLARAGAEQLALSAGGAPVAFELVGRGRDAAVRFEGLRLSADSYTPRNVYWLRQHAPGAAGRAQGAAGAAPRPQASPTPVSATGIVTATIRLEEKLAYDGQAKAFADRWYWQTLFAPAETTISFAAPGVAGGQGELRVFVISKSSAPVDPDHRLFVFLNGAFVSDAAWDGARPHLITAAISDGILKADENELAIRAPGDTGAIADSVHLQRVEVAYPRTRAADGSGAVLSPVSVAAATGSSLPDWPGGADLVIVTVPQFRDALMPLVEAREAQGLRVAVLDVEQVYDAFSHGRVDPAAIQALMRHARQAWAAPAPAYLLLAGDASYDPMGWLEGMETDLVPARSVYTAFSGWTGSDVWYALPDDGPATPPAFAVGRFPAQTAEQLAVMLQKTLDYERQAGDLEWRSNVLLVADNDEPGFAEETAAFAGRLGRAAQQVMIEGDGTNAREALEASFRDGAGLIGYFGHGSVTLWAQEKVFDVAAAAKLDNAARLPIVFTVTCLSGFFEHPTTVSLGEVLLRQGGGGAVAALVPSSAAVLSDQRLLALGLAGALATPGGRGLGDIVLDAQRALPQQTGGVRDILLTFNLLGDPSLKIAR